MNAAIAVIAAITALVTAIGVAVAQIRHVTGPAHIDPPPPPRHTAP